jgi:hypothetical protein
MKRWLVWSGLGVFLAGALTLVVSANEPIHFKYSTFTVPPAVTLSVNAINNYGTISGYYYDASNNVISFVRSSNGKLTYYSDPADTATPGFTRGFQINDQGTVAGQFYNSAALEYSGYLFNNGHFSTFNVPDEPAGSTTAAVGINDLGTQICGWFAAYPDFSPQEAFISSYGKVELFAVHGSTVTACFGLNNRGYAVGTYEVSSGAIRGFLRSPNGEITDIDFPGAPLTPGTAPCVGTIAGTQPFGINDNGVISGHFWDSEYNEHGFLRYPNGIYQQFDIPGAYQTSGGSLNDAGTVVGHYADSSCNSYGYIADFQ